MEEKQRGSYLKHGNNVRTVGLENGTRSTSFSHLPQRVDDAKSSENISKQSFSNECNKKHGICVVILCAATFLHGFSGSLAYSIGTLFVDWSETFDSSKSETAWILSLNLGLMFLTGPISAALCQRFGERTTAVCGSLIATLGLASSAYCTNVAELYATHGVLSGIGFGLMQMSAMSSVGRHFDKRRTLAMGVVSFGSGSCVFALPYMHRAVADVLTWRGLYVILAALVLHGVVMGALLRPPRVVASSVKNPTVQSSDGNKVEHWWEMLSLCTDIRLVIFVLGNIIMGFGGNTLPAVVVDYAVDIGISKAHGARLLSLIGLGGLLGRLVVLPLMMSKIIQGKAIHMYVVGGVLRAVGTVLCPTTSSFAVLSILNTAYGMGLGIQISTGTPLLPEVFGAANMPYYFGFYYFSLGIGSILGSPVAGWLYDILDSYDLPLYLNGLITLTSVMFHVAVICIPAPTIKAEPNITANNTSADVEVSVIFTNRLSETTDL